jgi:hypothetical protein
MTEWINIIGLVLAGGGIGGLVKVFIELKSVKLIQAKAQAEARGVEADNHSKLDSRFEKFIDLIQENHKREMEQLEKRIAIAEATTTRVEAKFDKAEKRNVQYRYAISKVKDCKIPSDKCPIWIADIEFTKDLACEDCKIYGDE